MQSRILLKKKENKRNHYHKKTIQWNYLLKGKIIIFSKFKRQKTKSITLKVGDLVATYKNESHAIKAIQDSEFLVFTQGPRRGGKEYENDTFRLKIPLV